ncbi:TIM barrel protein [Thermus sediminis]|uniref:TIM barrel protein n=1 Tax=Thermus sediminis TaxID=1761908 RepID=UPI000E3E57DF|nr:TIM barrel protein [Thermus sediminis]
MDVRLSLHVRNLKAKAPLLEALGLGAEAYLDPELLEDDELFGKMPALSFPLSVHLPFWNLDLLSPDPEVAGLTLRRLLLGLERAVELGADRAVLHSGIPAGRTPEEALERAPILAEALRPVVRRARALGVALFLENTHEPDPASLRVVLEALPELGFCFDPSHAQVFSRTPAPEPWLALAPDHLHLNDHDGTYDRHWNLGRGVGRPEAWLGGCLEATLVLEVRGDPTPSLRWLEGFFDRALTEAP